MTSLRLLKSASSFRWDDEQIRGSLDINARYCAVVEASAVPLALSRCSTSMRSKV